MPRSIIRALIRGQPAARPLFLPVIFTLAARLEDIPLPTFVRNPTKISNALTAIHRSLKTDGMTSYFDLSVVADGPGGELEWNTPPPATIAPPRHAVRNTTQP